VALEAQSTSWEYDRFYIVFIGETLEKSTKDIYNRLRNMVIFASQRDLRLWLKCRVNQNTDRNHFTGSYDDYGSTINCTSTPPILNWSGVSTEHDYWMAVANIMDRIKFVHFHNYKYVIFYVLQLSHKYMNEFISCLLLNLKH
jgi:hypothetical protein